MNKLEIQKLFYHPICTKEEIERIFNVNNGLDYLLKLRADTIVDHTRLFRVYSNKALMGKEKWSLEGSFDKSHYRKVLKKLSEEDQKACNEIIYGDIFSNEPNGMIFTTEFGIITSLSESLRFFLEFAHLAILDFKSDIPSHVRNNSLRIAIRTMLKTESLDFFMDPRGIIPKKIAHIINYPINLQMQFIVGHEFAHHILGHLDNKNIIEQPIFHAISSNDSDYKSEKVFNNSQKNEFEADIYAISSPKYSNIERARILHAALLWFVCLELYEAASDVMFPEPPWCKSHPSARERYENLLTNIPTPNGFDLSSWTDFRNVIDEFTEFVKEDVSLNFKSYALYGSVYLDKPNTEWRGKELIDRVDYY